MKSHRKLMAVTTALFTLPLCAIALSSPDMQGSKTLAKGESQAAQMVPANAALLHNLDATKDHPGSTVKVKLATTAHLKDGTELPSGTVVTGKVVKDDMNHQGTSKLALQFTQAELKDGKIVPIKATIVGVFGPASQGFENYPVRPGTQVPISWSNKTLQVDQLNALPGVDLHSNVASKNSGVLVSTKKDVKIRNGSEIQLAIAPQAETGISAGAASAGQS